MDIEACIHAVQSLRSEDAFPARLSPAQWRQAAPYFVQRSLRMGEVLIHQGLGERAMHLLAQGNLQVLTSNSALGSRRVSILRAGAVVGESSLFGASPALASVESLSSPCIVWSLPGTRLDEMAQRAPGLALELLRAAGAVAQVRLRAQLRGELASA